MDWRPAGTAAPSPDVEEVDAASRVVNPIGVLVRHLSGADVFWVGEMAAGRASGRVRAREFTSEQPSLGELRTLVERCRGIVDEALAGLKDGDLADDASPPSPDASTHPLLDGGEPMTRLYCILHALGHHGHHNGQLKLLRRLWVARRR